MANQEHLDILKQGVDIWNQWRWEHLDILPHLEEADLNGIDLSKANLFFAFLTGANLTRAFLTGTDLSSATLTRANLREAILIDAKLGGADLSSATLTRANLREAILNGANLFGADLSKANFFGANLSRVDLREANLWRANLWRANLSSALAGNTIFSGLDLRQVKGLETMRHSGPSEISISTIYRSMGEIPEALLEGIGVPSSLIEYIRSLVGKAIDYYTCFISYSSKDEDFAKRLYVDLQREGVRCWFAPEDMKIGDEIRSRIDESIRIYDKLLLVLSEHSVESIWVKKEVETAFEKELQQNRLVLFPVRLDDTVLHASKAWAADIRRMRHIGDFRNWKHHDEYEKAFARLLRDLKAAP